MKSPRTILQSLPDHLFWDVDQNSLDIQKDKALIIPRALFATTESTFEEDITRLELLYPPDQIVNTLKETKELVSNKVCGLVANRYTIPPFKRFGR